LKDLLDMDPYEFERLVGALWKKMGYKVDVQSKSKDRGIDIVATKQDPFSRKQLLQTKRYGESNKIGSQKIRTYRTLYDQEPNVDTVAVITTGTFTDEALQLAADLHVETVNGVELCNLLVEHAESIQSDFFGVDGDEGEDQIDGTKYEHLLGDQHNQISEKFAEPQTTAIGEKESDSAMSHNEDSSPETEEHHRDQQHEAIERYTSLMDELYSE
jgi:hypothetical protein